MSSEQARIEASDRRHGEEMALREQAEASLTQERVRQILRTHSHLLANKSAQEIELLRAVILHAWIAGTLGSLP